MVVKNVPVGQVPLKFDDEERMIREVNAKYNKLISYKTQPGNNGKGAGGVQFDNLPDGGEGDCDTYARTKGEALAQAGFPKNKLSIAMAKMWNGVEHAVLKVDRGEGKYVYLTNPQNDVQRNNPDESILNELPGKDMGYDFAYPLWEPMNQSAKKKREGQS